MPSTDDPEKGWLKLYIPSRTAFVLRRIDTKKKKK
jgi:hypothetical protein